MQELNFTPTRARRLEHSQSVKRYNEYSETAQTNTAQSMAEGAGPSCRGSTTVRHSQFRRTGLPLTALLGATALWAAGCLAQVDDPQAEPAAGGPSVGGAPMAGGGGRSAVVPLAGRSSLGNAGTSWMSTSGAGGRASGGSVSSGAVGGAKNGGESGTLSGAGAMNAGGRLGSSGASNSGGTPNGTSGAPTGGSSRGGAASTAEPELPPITGSCPAFKTGTATIGGLNGISLQVGPKREGTGALLFYWHGTGSRASEVNSMMPSSVRSAILDEGGIIVSFQGSVGMGGDCSGTSTFSKDDFKIADTIAACAVRDHGINPRRIYTTGCSAGGLQAGCDALQLHRGHGAEFRRRGDASAHSEPIDDAGGDDDARRVIRSRGRVVQQHQRDLRCTHERGR